MKRIHEAIAEKYNSFTKGQVLLANYISEHCDKAAFLNSFELAEVTGVSQSTVMRFASALGYEGYIDFQQAMQVELKYRLTTLERFEQLDDADSDADTISKIAMIDAMNIKKNSGLNQIEQLQDICTRLTLSFKIYVYGQGYASAAAAYLTTYLRMLLHNVSCVNLTGLDPLMSIADISSGDMLFCIGFPLHSKMTKNLIAYARQREACVVTVSESHSSELAQAADANLACECGDYGVNGSMAPVISLLCSLTCLLARNDEMAQRKLRAAGEAAHFEGVL